MPKADDAIILKTGVDFTPLLEGSIQFGEAETAHENLETNELRLRNVSSLLTNDVRMLATKIKESECSG